MIQAIAEARAQGICRKMQNTMLPRSGKGFIEAGLQSWRANCLMHKSSTPPQLMPTVGVVFVFATVELEDLESGDIKALPDRG